jgi:hypothetical protein
MQRRYLFLVALVSLYCNARFFYRLIAFMAFINTLGLWMES